MAEMISFHLDVVSAEGKLFSGRVQSAQVSGSEGELGLRHGHAPLLTAIKPGLVRLIKQNGSEEVLYISGGMLEVQPEAVTVLADTAIRADDLDEAKAQEAKRRAEERIHSSHGDIDYAQAVRRAGQSDGPAGLSISSKELPLITVDAKATFGSLFCPLDRPAQHFHLFQRLAMSLNVDPGCGQRYRMFLLPKVLHPVANAHGGLL